MIDRAMGLPVLDPCRLLSLARSTYYYEGASETGENLALMRSLTGTTWPTPRTSRA